MRPRFQFGLRTLLVVAAGVALLVWQVAQICLAPPPPADFVASRNLGATYCYYVVRAYRFWIVAGLEMFAVICWASWRLVHRR